MIILDFCCAFFSQAKRQKLFVKTSKGKPSIIPEGTILSKDNSSSIVEKLIDDNLKPSKRKVIRGQDGKLHFIESQVQNTAVDDIEQPLVKRKKRSGTVLKGGVIVAGGTNEARNNQDGYYAMFPWLRDVYPDDSLEDLNSYNEFDDPDDNDKWTQLWLEGGGESDIPPSSQHNIDGIYKEGLLPSLPCHLMIGEKKGCNLLLIIADQHRHDYIGSVDEKTASITPILDHQMHLGAVFETAVTYVPVCVPSRASLLTGMSAESSGITSGADLEVDFKFQTIFEALSKHRYMTGYFGKWHNSNKGIGSFNITTWGHKYLQQSFDPIMENSQVYRRWLSKTNPAPPPKDGQLLHRKAGWGWPYTPIIEFEKETLMSKSKGKTYKALPQWALFGIQEIPTDVSMSQYTALQASKAIHDFTQRELDQPFAMMVSFQKPHPPMLVGEGYWDEQDVLQARLPPNWQDKSLKFPYTKKQKYA